MAIEARS